MADEAFGFGGFIQGAARAAVQGAIGGPSAFPDLPEAPSRPAFRLGAAGYADQIAYSRQMSELEPKLSEWRTNAMRTVLVKNGHFSEEHVRNMSTSQLED